MISDSRLQITEEVRLQLLSDNQEERGKIIYIHLIPLLTYNNIKFQIIINIVNFFKNN